MRLGTEIFIMRLKYTLSPEQLFDFQMQFSAQVKKRIVAAWAEKLWAYLAIAAFGTLCVLFTRTLLEAVILWWLSLLIVVGLNYSTQRTTARAFKRHYRDQAGALEWEQWIEGGRFYSKNREVVYSFPIDAFVVLTKDAEYIWLEFNDRGRARVPLSAFESPEKISEFESYFANAKKDHEKQTEPHQTAHPTTL